MVGRQGRGRDVERGAAKADNISKKMNVSNHTRLSLPLSLQRKAVLCHTEQRGVIFCGWLGRVIAPAAPNTSNIPTAHVVVSQAGWVYLREVSSLDPTSSPHKQARRDIYGGSNHTPVQNSSCLQPSGRVAEGAEQPRRTLGAGCVRDRDESLLDMASNDGSVDREEARQAVDSTAPWQQPQGSDVDSTATTPDRAIRSARCSSSGPASPALEGDEATAAGLDSSAGAAADDASADTKVLRRLPSL